MAVTVDDIKPSEGFRILKAHWRDLGELRRLERVCFKLDSWPLWDLIGVLTFPDIIRLKANIGESMIGFIAADIRKSKRVSWIATICVHPDYQKMGIGTALLEACETQITIPKIRLCVRESNHPAINLYLEAGYKQVDYWQRYYRGGENALVFEKDRQL